MCHARPGIWSFGMTVKFTYSVKWRKPSTHCPCPTAILFFFYHSQFFKCTIHRSTPFSHYYTVETSYWLLYCVPLKCPMDKYQCLFWVLVLLDLYFTFLVYPATQEFSPLACGVLFDHFPQFLAFLYWSYFSSPQKITLVSWFYPVSFLYSLVLIYFDCLHLIFCISFQ